jgi:HSP20 family protein
MSKKSFFQKLTGSDENENEQEMELELEKEEPIAPAKEKPATHHKNKPAKKTSEDNEEWLPETEGQLTIDVYQTPSDIIIKSTVAGVEPENIDISISNDMVTIKGARRKDEEVKTEDYYYQECYWGAFSRSVILPIDIEADKAEASFKNGILTIRLPKIEKVKTKKIKVKAS